MLPRSDTTFTLEIELLTGVYRAAMPDGGAEWPPHPDRVFCALVQAWADGGKKSDEAAALRWLEQLEPPVIDADPVNDVHKNRRVFDRDSAAVYVPPNDATDVSILPAFRRRQARTFAATFPESPIIGMRWNTSTLNGETLHIAMLAERVASIGHSSSLVRCHVIENVGAERAWIPTNDGSGRRLRVPRGGRFDALEAAWQHGRRPSRSDEASYRYAETSPPRRRVSPFADRARWFVFRTAPGSSAPALADFAHIADALRRPFRELSSSVREVVVGLDADRRPLSKPHLAIVPLANVGWSRSDGDLKGFALVFPSDLDERRLDESILAIAEHFRQRNASEDIFDIPLGADTWSVLLDIDADLASLRPDRYARTATRWGSVTPVVLDRVPRDPQDIGSIIARACLHAGLIEPIEVRVSSDSIWKGAPSSIRSPHHATHWRFPSTSPLVGRLGLHVELEFGQAIIGPVLIGAGRYSGFGLCLPIDESS